MRNIFIFICVVIFQVNTFSQNNDEHARKVYAEALSLHESGNYSQSNLKLMEVERELGKTNPSIQYFRIMNYYMLKRYEKCKTAISQYLSTNPKKDSAFDEVLKINTELNSLTKQDESSKDSIHFNVEQMPEFPGGMDAFREYIATNLIYPEEIRKMGIQGKVIVSFVLSSNGSVRDIEINRSLNPECDYEVIRLFNNIPDWKPGKEKGKYVNVKYTLPINFALN